MTQPPRPRGLGRGLSALLGDEDVAAAVSPSPSPEAVVAPGSPQGRAPLVLPIAQLRPGRYQPRTTFDGLDILVDSVRQFGLLQPILVRPADDQPDTYEIIAGERRWRAAQKAQLHEVPVVLRRLDDLDALQLALVENLQRADLSPIDEAAGFRRLMSDFGQTQEQVAATVGKSRPHVANTLRLLDLPAGVQQMIQRNELSPGHGRALLGFADPVAMAARAVQGEMSVRELERLAAADKAPKARTSPRKPAGEASKSADTYALEKRIEEALGLKAELTLRGGEQSLLTLEIRDFDQLDGVVERLTRRT